jgi:hypothetical protein
MPVGCNIGGSAVTRRDASWQDGWSWWLPSWTEFLRAQACGAIACEFLTVETVGLTRLFVSLFSELARAWGGSTLNDHTRDTINGQTAQPPASVLLAITAAQVRPA